MENTSQNNSISLIKEKILARRMNISKKNPFFANSPPFQKEKSFSKKRPHLDVQLKRHCREFKNYKRVEDLDSPISSINSGSTVEHKELIKCKGYSRREHDWDYEEYTRTHKEREGSTEEREEESNCSKLSGAELENAVRIKDLVCRIEEVIPNIREQFEAVHKFRNQAHLVKTGECENVCLESNACNKKTLVLDLDHTLVYFIKSITPSIWAQKFGLKVSTSRKGNHFVLRPFALPFLKIIKRYYEIIVFSSSQSQYCNDIVNCIDPFNKYFTKVLSRDNCIKYRQFYIKDLTIIQNRHLKDLVIVDDSILPSALNFNNFIPITPFTGGVDDNQFISLSSFLLSIHEEQDLRESLKKQFNLSKLFQLYLQLKNPNLS